MAFTGFSSDEEGSIVFDGEQFIINNPNNVPDDFDPHGRPVIGLPVTHPNHPQNQQPVSSSDPVTGLAPFDTGPSVFHTHEYTQYGQPPSSKEEAERREQRIKKARQRFQDAKKRATNAPSLQVIDAAPDFADLGFIDSEPLPASVAPDWPGSTPLSQGRSLHVDHLLSVETDTLAREVLIGIKRDGIPPKAFVNDFMAQYAEWGWDELSSARALQVLEIVRNSDWDERLQQADSATVETLAQDLADNTIEGLTVINAKTGRVLLNRIGVLGAGGSQYVGLQDHEVEAFKGLELIFIHNHPNASDASEADLRAAFEAGAEMLMVVTPKGYEYVYMRGAHGMIRVRAEEASYAVAPGTAEEHALLEAKSWEQARRDGINPPEFIMLQEEQLWWEREKIIIVPYNTTETREQVAARMAIPVELLDKLNGNDTGFGTMYIPLPGWYSFTTYHHNESLVAGAHSTGATFFDWESVLEQGQLISEWRSLRPVEQQIEMALMGSNAISIYAPFNNVGYDFDYTVTWIHDREAVFHQAASDFDIPVALLKTVIASELLYDYDAIDQWQDNVIRANLNLLGRQFLWRINRFRDSWDGAGVANVHYPTLIDAYTHVNAQLEPGETHPWNLGSIDSGHKVPNLLLAPDIPVSNDDVSNYYDDVSFETLVPRQIETARFVLRLGRLDEVPRELRTEIAHYLADDSGSVRAAAMVLRMIIDQLTEFDSNANINEDPRDMARAWGRYRTSLEYFDYGGNARLAHPLAEYWSTR